MRVRLLRCGHPLDLPGQHLQEGKEGKVFVVTVPGVGKCAFKLFSEPARQRARKLRVMIEHPPAFVTAGGHHVAWPVDIGTNEAGEMAGYLMPFARGTSLADYYGHASLALRVRLALNAARVLEPIHRCGYKVGDFHDDNTLGNADGTVTFVDCESFVFGEFRWSLGREDFLPPELATISDLNQAPRTFSHDYWSFATMVFLLVMQCHPFQALYTGKDGQPLGLTEKIAAGCWPYARTAKLYVPPPDAPPFTALPPGIQSLFRRAFELGHGSPSLRPDASEWKRALEEFDRQLTNEVAPTRRRQPPPALQAATAPARASTDVVPADPDPSSALRAAPMWVRPKSLLERSRTWLTALCRWCSLQARVVWNAGAMRLGRLPWARVGWRQWLSWECIGAAGLIVMLLLLWWWSRPSPPEPRQTPGQAGREVLLRRSSSNRRGKPMSRNAFTVCSVISSVVLALAGLIYRGAAPDQPPSQAAAGERPLETSPVQASDLPAKPSPDHPRGNSPRPRRIREVAESLSGTSAEPRISFAGSIASEIDERETRSGETAEEIIRDLDRLSRPAAIRRSVASRERPGRQPSGGPCAQSA